MVRETTLLQKAGMVCKEKIICPLSFFPISSHPNLIICLFLCESMILTITVEVVSHFSDMRDVTSHFQFLSLCTVCALDTSVKSPYISTHSLFWADV